LRAIRDDGDERSRESQHEERQLHLRRSGRYVDEGSRIPMPHTILIGYTGNVTRASYGVALALCPQACNTFFFFVSQVSMDDHGPPSSERISFKSKPVINALPSKGNCEDEILTFLSVIFL